MLNTGTVGQTGKQGDGATPSLRLGRLSDLIISALRGDYSEATTRGMLFHAMLATTSTTIAAGNINGAAPAASTQFALWNPTGSGVNLELTKFFMAAISGTPPGGPVFHSTAQGVPNSNVGVAAPSGFLGGPSSVARYLASAAGAALTNSPSALAALRPSTISLFAAAIAAGGNIENTLEEVKGDIVIPPGYLWVPTWSAAGTTFLNAYGVSWLEVPI